MLDRLQTILTDLNLNPKEIRCYLACLKLRKAKVSDIAKQARLDRTACYQYLKTLEKIGLISFDFKKYNQQVTALPLQKILALLENRQRKLKRRSLEFKELLPQVEKKFKIKHNQIKIRYFEGLNGIKEIYWDTLEKPHSEILNFSSVDDVLTHIPGLITKYIHERVAKGIKVKILVKKTVLALTKLPKTVIKELREYKYLPKNYELTSEIVIYNNKVATISFRHQKMWGMIIEDRELCGNLKVIFEMLWTSL